MATTKSKSTTRKSTKAKATKAKAGSNVDLATVGRYTFLAGVALAVLAGIFFVAAPAYLTASAQMPVIYLLIALGLIGGYIHIGSEKQNGFFLVALAMSVFSSSLNYIPTLGTYLTSILTVLGVFLGIAAVAVVARNVISWFRS